MLTNKLLLSHLDKKMAQQQENMLHQKEAQEQEMRRQKQKETLTNYANIGANAAILYLSFHMLESINELPTPIKFLLSIIALYFFNTIAKAAESAVNTTHQFFTETTRSFKITRLKAELNELKKITIDDKHYVSAQEKIHKIGEKHLQIMEKEVSSKSSEAYYQMRCIESTQFLLDIAEGIGNLNRRESILMRARLYCTEALDHEETAEEAQILDGIIRDKLLATCCTEIEHWPSIHLDLGS